MGGREELKQELELQWVQYRQKMLDIMEEKLLQMREIAEQAKQGNLTAGELEELNARLNNLVTQVKALDGESRKTEDERILE
jgi:flagellin-like hook-associated protein FlgL